MKALVLEQINQYPTYKEVDEPTAAAGESVVELSAAALNHRDVWICKGQYAGITTPIILGSDGVGMVGDRRVLINPGHQWGSEQAVQSKSFKILGLPENGTLAERCVVKDKYLYDVPDYLDDAEAAALPLAGVTAYRALVVKCKPRRGDAILITGIGGGVALFALQYAIAIGCAVYVTSSSQEKIDEAIELGATDGGLYTDPDWAKHIKSISGGIDVAIDSAGGPGFAAIPKICNPGARIAFYGGTRGKIDGLSPQIVFYKQISIFGSTMGSDRDFQDMLDFVSRHQIIPVVDQVFPFANGAKAFEKMEKGQQFGKLVVEINP